jgi:hypothetical protein
MQTRLPKCASRMPAAMPESPAPMIRTDLDMSFTHPGFQIAPGFDAAPNPEKENQENQES